MPGPSKAELQQDTYAIAVAKLQALRGEVAEVQKGIRLQIEPHDRTPLHVKYCRDTLVASDRRQWVERHAQSLPSKLAFCQAVGDSAFQRWHAEILQDVSPRLVPDAWLCNEVVGVPGTPHWRNAGAAWVDLDRYLSEMLNRARLGQEDGLPHSALAKSEGEQNEVVQPQPKPGSVSEIDHKLSPDSPKPPRSRGRRRIDEFHQKELAKIIASHMKDNAWMKPDILEKICRKLDRAKVPGARGRSWDRLLEDDTINGTHRVIDNIKYRLFKSPNPARNHLPK